MSWWRKASAVDNGSHNIDGWIKIQSIWRKASLQDTINSALSSNPWVVDGWLRIKSAWRYAGSGVWHKILSSLSIPAILNPKPYLVAVNSSPDNPMLQPNTKLYTTRGYWAEEPVSFNIQIQEKPIGGSWSAIAGQTHIKNYDEYLSSDGLDQFPPLASNRYLIPKSRVRDGYSYRTKHTATNAENLEGTYTTEAIMPRLTHGPIINTFTVSNETSYGAKFSWTLDGNVVDSPITDLFKQTIRIYDYETDELIYDDDVLINQQTITINEPTLLETGVTYTAEITVICQDGWSSTADPTQDFMIVDFTTGASLPGPARNVSIINVPGRNYNDGQVYISWEPPLDNGGSPIDYYRIQYAYDYDYSTWYTLSDTWTGTAMYAGPWTDGYTIKAKIWSHNAQGYTTQSAVSATAAYINTLPEVPTLLTATRASSTSIAASFTPNVNYGGTKGTGGSELTYLLWVMPTDGSSGFSKTLTTSPSTITGLTANKEYSVRVRATNDQGYVYSNEIIVDLLDRTPVATPGSAVLSLRSGPAGMVGSTYRITAPSFTNLPTEYYFDYEVANQGYNSYVNSGWISNNYWDYAFLSETSSTLTGRVYARNAYATSIGVYTSTSISGLKRKPGAPTITTSSTASSWSIGITFGADTTSVEIEYGQNTNYGSYGTRTSSGTFTPIGPFPSSTTYYFRITPFNSSFPGDSITGSVTTLRPPPGLITNPTAYSFSTRTAQGYFTTGANTDSVQYTLQSLDIPISTQTYTLSTTSSYPHQVSLDVSSLFTERTWTNDTWSPSTTYYLNNTVWYAGNEYRANRQVFRSTVPYDEIGFSGIPVTNTSYWTLITQRTYYVGDYVTYNGARYYAKQATTGVYPSTGSNWVNGLGSWRYQYVPYNGTSVGTTAYSSSTRSITLSDNAATDPLTLGSLITFTNVTSSSFTANYTSGIYSNYVYIDAYNSETFASLISYNKAVAPVTSYTETPSSTLTQFTKYKVSVTPFYYYSTSPAIYYQGVGDLKEVTTLSSAFNPPTITTSSSTTTSITLNFTKGENAPTTRAYQGASLDGSTTGTSYTFLGLSPGTSYNLYLYGFNGTSLSPTYSGGPYSTQAGAANTPTFGTNTSTSNGFTGSITNYDSNYNYTVTVPSPYSVSNATATGNIRAFTVTGLGSGASTTVTVQTTRPGYTSGSNQTTGTALTAASKLSTPTGVSASDTRTDGINITWNPVSGASYYGIWWGGAPSYDNTPDFQNISGTLYLDSGAPVGSRNYYVQAFASGNPTGTKSDWGGPDSGTRADVVAPSTPAITGGPSISWASGNNFTLSATASDATNIEFEVQFANTSGGTVQNTQTYFMGANAGSRTTGAQTYSWARTRARANNSNTNLSSAFTGYSGWA